MLDGFWDRREFVRFFSSASALGATGATSLLGARDLGWAPLDAAGDRDAIRVAEGFGFDRILTWGDTIGPQLTFGACADFLAFESDGVDSGMLFVNHESPLPEAIISGFRPGTVKSRDQVDIERKSVGASWVRIERKAGTWKVAVDQTKNRRWDATTSIPIVAPRAIAGRRDAIGTLGNCSGGVTPWGTFLTCEENYHDYYGHVDHERSSDTHLVRSEPSRLGWEKFYDERPELYGWVVEVHPTAGWARKLTALGRFAHEGATFAQAKDGRAVVYMGDDKEGGFLFKFVSATKDSLEAGTLYAADTVRGVWIPLAIERHEVLRKKFGDGLDVLIRAREAAQMLGATPQNRPEAIAIDPIDRSVVVALTNSRKRGDDFGSLLRLMEDHGDPAAEKFSTSVLLAGGAASGLACPDNLIFDAHGNLWVTTDMADEAMGRPPYESFGNNALFFVPRQGPSAGRALRVMSAPREAELTGPCLTPDGTTLFLSVQHPGASTTDPANPTSRWPDGNLPKSAVIAVRGPALS